MLRLAAALCVLSLALAPAAFAAGPPSPDIEQAATKTCNDALDRGNFGNYGTVEECVADTAQKMAKAQRRAAMKEQSVAAAKAPGQSN